MKNVTTYDGQTTDAKWWQKLIWPLARWAKKIRNMSCLKILRIISKRLNGQHYTFYCKNSIHLHIHLHPYPFLLIDSQLFFLQCYVMVLIWPEVYIPHFGGPLLGMSLGIILFSKIFLANNIFDISIWYIYQ